MNISFQYVCALWITPDFSSTLAGKRPPPRVDHAKVDFEELADALVTAFPYGPPVQIQVPNDTIDQVAVQVRATGKHSASMRCEDFGKALLARAKSDKGRIIDIHASWEKLHALPDRNFAPPPVIIPFVVTATDFEDAMLWHASTRPKFGLKMFDPVEAMVNSQSIDQNGTLPKELRSRLEHIFGTPYEGPAVLDRMYMDQPPQVYGITN